MFVLEKLFLKCMIVQDRVDVLTSLDRFMSRSTLMTMVDSVSLGLARLAAPNVRRTDRMFLRPKS